MFKVIRSINNIDDSDLLISATKSLERLRDGVNHNFIDENGIYQPSTFIDIDSNCIDAVCKAIPYRVRKVADSRGLIFRCPTCEKILFDLLRGSVSNYPNFCGNCGQKLSYEGVL